MQSWNHTSRFKSHFLLIWNFQRRLEMRCAIWNFLKLETFQPIIGDAYLKLSGETWEKMWYSQLLKLLKLETFETFQIHQRGCLLESSRWDLKSDVPFETFETWNFEVSFKDKKFQWTLNVEVINLLIHRVDILLLSALMFAFSNH